MNSVQLILTRGNYFAPAWVFSSINILVGTWILYLPYIKSKFVLNDAEVGFALFFTACGLLFSIPIVPTVNRIIGVGQSTRVGIVVLAMVFNLPLLAPSYIALCASLFLVGVFSGFTDVSMNAVVAIIEKRDQEHLMSATHGFFSLGGFFGAGIGSLLIGRVASPAVHMLLLSSFVLISNLLLSQHYAAIIDQKPLAKTEKTTGFKNLFPVLGLAVISFIVLCNEGAVEHWSNLYLFEVVGLSENIAAQGFVLFSLTMTLGRFLGDGISKKFGAITTLIGGFIIAIIGYGSILMANAYSSILGFGFLGLGLSVVVPELVRLAGKNPHLNTSVAISTVSGIGFLGFLVGPVLLGLIAHRFTLSYSYVFLLSSVIIALGIVHFRLRKKYP